VAGRRREYRTWEELSTSERRRGLAILGGVGVVAVGAVVWVFGPADDASPMGAPRPVAAEVVAGSPAAAAATTPTADLTAWYASISGPRGDLTAAEASVRQAISELNGMALRPACALLGSRAADAQNAGAVPDGDAGQAWTKGLTAYQQAAHSCAELFDGTQVAPETLRADTTAALDAADQAWAALEPADAVSPALAQGGAAGPAGATS